MPVRIEVFWSCHKLNYEQNFTKSSSSNLNFDKLICGMMFTVYYRIYSPIGRTISFVLKKCNLELTRT